MVLTPLQLQDQPTWRAVRGRPWQTDSYALNGRWTFEGKPAREGMIRLRDQTGAVELIELKALIQLGGSRCITGEER
jgi:hypothetical protein